MGVTGSDIVSTGTVGRGETGVVTVGVAGTGVADVLPVGVTANTCPCHLE